MKVNNYAAGLVLSLTLGSIAFAGKIDYKATIELARKNYKFTETEKKFFELVILMSESSMDAVINEVETKKYKLGSTSEDEIDAIMLIGKNAAHGPNVPYMKQIQEYVNDLYKESEETGKKMVLGLRTIRKDLFMDNSKITSVKHALEVVEESLIRAYKVLVDGFKLEVVEIG